MDVSLLEMYPSPTSIVIFHIKLLQWKYSSVFLRLFRSSHMLKMSGLVNSLVLLIIVLANFNHNIAYSSSNVTRSIARRAKPSQSRHRHSTKVILNKPSLILLPPFEEQAEFKTPTEASFVIQVPSLNDTFQPSTEDAQKSLLNELIQPPFDYLLPPYLNHEELTAEIENASVPLPTSKPAFLDNVQLAFFISDLFDSGDFSTEIPTNNFTEVNVAETTISIKDSLFELPTYKNETLDNKTLIAQETGDFRNQILIHNELNNNGSEIYYDYGNQNKTPMPKQSKTSKNICRNHLGYVADVSNGCQTFYICTEHGVVEPMSCPKGTLFSQDFLVCDWWYNVECVERK